MTEKPAPSRDRKEIRERFGRALRDVLAAQGKSQADLATLMDVSQSAVTTWITGKREPSEFWLVFEMERALQLEAGTLSRILGFCPCNQTGLTLEGAILNADALSDLGRQAMLLSYQAWSGMNHRTS